MPATLYSTADAFPLLTGYTTRSFDSGLLLWQGTYLTPATSGLPFAEGDPIPDGDYGAIDGLYVHPAPVLKKSPGPLAEWTVTAYGRANLEGTARKSFLVGWYGYSIEGVSNDGTNTPVVNYYQGRALNETAIVSRVIHVNSSPGELKSPISLKSYRYPDTSKELVEDLETQGGFYSEIEITQSQTVNRFDTNSFGTFIEIIYSVSNVVNARFLI